MSLDTTRQLELDIRAIPNFQEYLEDRSFASILYHFLRNNHVKPKGGLPLVVQSDRGLAALVARLRGAGETCVHFFLGDCVWYDLAESEALAFLSKAGWELASDDEYLAERKRQIETRTGIYADET